MAEAKTRTGTRTRKPRNTSTKNAGKPASNAQQGTKNEQQNETPIQPTASNGLKEPSTLDPASAAEDLSDLAGDAAGAAAGGDAGTAAVDAPVAPAQPGREEVRYNLRLPKKIADYYERLAAAHCCPTGPYLSIILVDHALAEQRGGGEVLIV